MTPSTLNPSNNHHQIPQNPHAPNPQQNQLPNGQPTKEGQQAGVTSQNKKEEINNPTIPISLQSNTEVGGSKMPFFFDGSQLSNHIQTTMKETNSPKK